MTDDRQATNRNWLYLDPAIGEIVSRVDNRRAYRWFYDMSTSGI